MKKIIAMMLALMMVFALCACGNDNDKAGSGVVTEEDLKNDFVLKVGFDAEFPPFGFVAADGSYDGFDLAMAEEVCKRLGWGFEAVPVNWDAKDSELKAGNINCIWNGFTMTGLEDAYCWSDPYCENSIVMVVKADSGINSLADLEGKKVMSQAASSATKAIDANEELKSSLAEVVELGDYQMGFMELEQGTVDAVAVDIGVAISQINKAGEGKYVILDEKVSIEEYAIGFLLGNDALRDAVNDAVKEIAADGTMLKIAQSSNYVEQGLVVESLCMINK